MPISPATKGFIGAKQIAMMKKGARIVNCARGGLVDEEALYNAVQEGKLAGAAVDVFTKEPTTDNILFETLWYSSGLNDCITSPVRSSTILSTSPTPALQT